MPRPSASPFPPAPPSTCSSHRDSSWRSTPWPCWTTDTATEQGCPARFKGNRAGQPAIPASGKGEDRMDDRLSKACINLRVVPTDLLDALCSLSGCSSPPPGAHSARRVHERVLRTAAALPPGALQPGDVSAATEVRAGLL